MSCSVGVVVVGVCVKESCVVIRGEDRIVIVGVFDALFQKLQQIEELH